LSNSYAKCHYAECHHAECHVQWRYDKCHDAECSFVDCNYAEYHVTKNMSNSCTSVIIAETFCQVHMPSVIMPNVKMLNGINIDIRPNAIMLSAVMLNGMMPKNYN
jgi:hypothetical protein